MLLEQILGHDHIFRFLGEQATGLVYIIGGLFYLFVGILVISAIARRRKKARGKDPSG